jgi:hypothetical protein
MAKFRGAERALSRHLAIGGSAGLILLASQDAAFAYLDPGTGSILLQALIAGVIGTAAFARMYWTRFKEIVRRTFGSDHRGEGPKDQ